MTFRPHGKHVHIDENNPQGLGICDYTGFVHLRKDLVRQMEWRGNAIVWTGFYVGKSYADMPNEQLRPPLLPPDPVPLREPRVQQFQYMTFSNNPLPAFSQIQFTWDSLWNNEDGTQTLTNAQALQQLETYHWGT